MKKSVITLLIFLIMIISVSAVSAADDASDLGASDDATISVANTDTAVAADGPVKNFTDLGNDIAASGNIKLDSDYKINDTETTVSIGKIGTVDGQGHIIDADGKSGIFEVSDTSSLTLKNMILKNANNYAIVNYGTLTLDNVTFYNCTDTTYNIAIGSGTGSDLTVKNCIFDCAGNDYQGIATHGKLSLDNNTFINSNKDTSFVVLASGSSLATDCTIYVKASAGTGTEWNEITAETSKIVDDNNNLIGFNSIAVGSWSVTLNDIAIAPTTATSTTRGVEGKGNAVSYGTNIVEIKNEAILPSASVVTASVNVTPDKQDTVFTLTTDTPNPVWKDNVTIIITATPFDGGNLGLLNATGDIQVSITPGSTETLTLVNGSANYTIKNVAVGNYNVLVQYAGDDHFKSGSLVAEPAFTVAEKPIPEENVTVTVIQSEYGKQQVTIELLNDATGFITAYIGSTASEPVIKEANLVDGKVSFDATQTPGTYDLWINYTSTGNYASYDSYRKDLIVPKLTTEIKIDVENTTYGNNVTFNITLNKDVAKASVAVALITETAPTFVDVTLTNGTATINKGKLDAGDYIIIVKALDEKYEDCTTNTTFNVAQINPEMAMVIGKYVLFEDVQVNVTVKNFTAGSVTLVVNYGNNQKKEYTNVALDENGTAKFTIEKIAVGINNIVATLNPDDTTNVNASSIEENITVAKLTPEISLNPAVVEIGEDGTFTVNLTNYGTEYAPTGALLVTFKGQESTYQLVSGEANVVIPKTEISTLGKYTINVQYLAGDANYTTNSADLTFEVIKWNVDVDATVAVADNNATITITVDYGSASALSENFTIDIKDADNVTVKSISKALVKGDNQVNVTLGVGNYTAVISYPGDAEHYANSTTTDAFIIQGAVKELAVEIMNVTYPNNATAVVTADVDGAYNVTVGGKAYTVNVVNGEGSVTLDVLAANTYTATVKSIMELYPSGENTTKFTVKQATPVATLTIENVVYPNQAIAIVNADVDGTYYVIAKAGSDGPYPVHVVNGTGNTTLELIDAGSYTYALNGVEGNDNYTNTELVSAVDVEVFKGTVIVNLTVDNILYPNKTKVSINASKGGDYIINIIDKNGVVNQTATVTLPDNVAQDVEFDTSLVPGTYTVDVAATILNYNPVKLNKTYVVDKGIIYYSINVTNITYAGLAAPLVTVTTTVPGSEATLKKGYAIFFGDATSPICYINGNDTDKEFGLYNYIDPLAAGTYTVKVVPIETDPEFKYYTFAESNSTTFEVEKGVVTFDIEVTSPVQYPNNVTVTIKESSINCTYIVTIGDFTEKVDVVAGVPKEVNITDFAIGIYEASVASDNVNYTTVTKTADVMVTQGPIHPSVADVEAYYLEDTVVVVKSDVDGAYTVTVDKKDYTVNVVNGIGNVTLDVLAVGSYDVKLTATILPFTPYLNNSIATVKINAAPVALSIEVTNVTYPDNATATVSANVTGSYKITIGAEEYAVVNITTTPGVMKTETVVLKPLGANTYTATVGAKEIDGNFTVDPVNCDFVVAKATPVIIIDIKDSYGVYEDIAVNVTVPYGTGKVKITSDIATEAIKYLVNGTANYTFNTADNFGEHTLTVQLDDPNFDGGLKQVKFVVTKISTQLNITFNNATYLQEAIITVNIANNNTVDPNGLLTVANVGSQQITSKDPVSFSLGSDLPAGEYTYNITYFGDSAYDYVSELCTINIAKLPTAIEIIGVTSAIYPNNATVTFRTNTTGNITIEVIDAEGNVVKTIDVGNVVKEIETTVNIAGLTAGNYTANVTYVENDNYNSSTNSTKVFDIYKANATIDAVVIPAVYPDNATVEVNATESGYYAVAIIDEKGEIVDIVVGELVANETASVVLPQLNAGTYLLKVGYDSDNYTAKTIERNLTISKGVPEIIIVAVDATYPENGIVNITCSADGEYTVTVGTFTATGNFTAGETETIPVDGLGAGTYQVVVNYAENANYNATLEIGSLTIEKAYPEIIMEVDTYEAYENATLLVAIPYATGSQVTINGKNVDLVDFMGLGEYALYNIGILQPGTYNFTAVYAGDANLTVGNYTKTFTVNKTSVNLTVTVENTTYGTDPIMTITLDNKDDVIVDLIFDDVEEESIVIKNGFISGPIEDLAAGEHKVVVKYAGSDKYDAETKTVYYTVAKAPVTVEVTAADVTYPTPVTVTVKSNVAGVYTVTVGSYSDVVTLEAGVAKDITVARAAGTYYVSASCEESENYTAGHASTSVTVNKVENTTITVEATSPLAGENATVTVTLPADATGTVDVKYGNGVYSAPVVNGTAVVSVPTTVAGTENATVQYSGDENYAPAETQVEISVGINARIIAENITRAINSPYDYYATFVDGNGNPISDVEITFYIAGAVYKAKTNASGIATVSAGLVDSAKPYEVIVTNPYTLENTTATTTIVPRLIVVSGTLTADYLENPPYVVQVIGDDGNPVGEGVYVEIVFAKKTYNMTTNATGHVVRTIGLAPGQYGVYARYQGYRTDQTVFIVNQVLKATSGTLKKTAKKYTLKATLKHTNGKAIANKVVKLTFNGKTYNVKTNSKGVASKTIKSSAFKNLKAGKTYTLKARYVNDVVKGKIKVVSK